MTGGQLNLSGILFQLLASLRSGADATVEDVRVGEDGASVRLVAEPSTGGDVEVTQAGRVTVDQIKIRRGKDPWTTRVIVEEVLTDLFKAKQAHGTARFRFVTDNLEGTTALSGFLNDVRALHADKRAPTALDTLERPFRWGAERISAADLFGRIIATLKAEDVAGVWDFLAATEIVGFTQAQLTTDIDDWLAELVSEREDVPVRRNALLQELLRLGAAGQSISASGLLRAVGVDPAVLTHARTLPAALATKVREQAEHFRYDAVMDVRPAPAMPDVPLTIFSGDSGQGKTWRLYRAAKEASERGECVVLLPARGTFASIEKAIVERVWSHVYDRPLSLTRVAQRLGAKLSRANGVWLTVFLDDLLDPDLAEELMHSSLHQLGIRLVVSAQHRITRMLTSQVEGLREIAVPDFTLAELREYLTRAGRDPSLVPDDVLLSLARPVLASIYRRIPGSENWRAVTEYELIDEYWRWATTQSKKQALHLTDAAAIHGLAGVLLDGPVSYPWTAKAALAHNVDAGVRERLLEVGVVREHEDGALSIVHDRILNWVVAGEIERRFHEGELSVQGVADTLANIDQIQTTRGDRLGRRLGYVTHDVLWRLARSAKAEDAGALALLLVRPGGVAARSHEHFYAAGLGSLGQPVLPALAWMAEQAYPNEEWMLPRLVATALIAVANDAPSEVAKLSAQLVATNTEHSREVGLRTLATVAAPSAALELLWSINTERNGVLKAAQAKKDSDWTSERLDKDQSFAALKRAASTAPDWVAAKAQEVSDAGDAEQLIWILMHIDLAHAKPIWTAAKANLLKHADEDGTGAPSAIRRFTDRDELPRVESALKRAKRPMAGVWFYALARLDPDRALAALDGLNNNDLWGTSQWWLPAFAHRTGPRVIAKLRDTIGAEREDDEEPKLNELAILLASQSEHLDPETFDLVIDSYEACLAADAARGAPSKKTRSHLRRLIASAATPALLARLSERAGSEFERLLTARAIGRSGRIDMNVDSDGEGYRQILAAIGGKGYDDLVLAELGRENEHARCDGVTAAVWTRNEDVRAKLLTIASSADADGYRQTQLMDALAAHRLDAGLSAMVRNGAPVYLRSVDIRDSGPEWEAEDIGVILELLKSALPEERRRGIRLCGFLSVDQAAELLAPLFADNGASDDEIAHAVSVLRYMGHYNSAFLPRVKKLLVHDEQGISIARYLAWAGDADARAAVVAWLDSHELKSLRSSETPIALHLLRFEESAPGAIAFLKRVLGKGLGHSEQGDLYAALANAGDPEAPAKLESIAYQDPRRGTGSVVAAIRTLAKTSSLEAFAAAERFCRRTRSDAAARLVLELDPHRGMHLLLQLYPGATIATQQGAGRALRWLAPRAELIDELAGRAKSADPSMRELAAEIAGWMPFEQAVPFLSKLADDEDEDVERAALAALGMRRADEDCAALIAGIPSQPRPRQWAWLHALIRRGAPDLLAHIDDPRSIQKLTNALGDEFLAEANKELKTRMREVDRAVENAQRLRDR